MPRSRQGKSHSKRSKRIDGRMLVVMGPSGRRARAGRALPGDEAVTPVVGTLLILAITIVGMAGILAWGAPTIESIQAQNAQAAIVGEFEELRASAIELSIPDASRIPTVNLPKGSLGVEQGTRVMVTANHATAACDFHVTDWSDTTSPTSVTVALVGCNTVGTDLLEVLQVAGSNTITKYSGVAASGAVTVAGVDFTQGNWLFRVTDNAATNPTVRAQAWLFDSDRISWELPTSSGTVAAHYDLGAVFSDDRGSVFLEKGPSLQENEFGANVYALRVRTLTDAGGTSGISGRGAYQVFLGLVGNHVRVDSDEVYRLRYDFQGDLAESWCGVLMLRNNGLSGAAYAEDDTLRCQQANAAAVRSVVYTKSGTLFALEVIHASMRVTLAA